jgi:hypothetical protein
VVILGTSKEEVDKINEIKNELLDLIDQRFSDFNKQTKEQHEEIVSLSNKRTIDTVKIQKELLNETLEKVNLIKQELEKKFNNAIKTLNKAAKVLELNNLEIDASSLINLFEVVDKNDKWISKYSGDVETIRQDYMDFKDSLPIGDKQSGVFKGLHKKVDKFNRDISYMPIELKRMENVVQKMQNTQKNISPKMVDNNDERILSTSRRNVNEISRGDLKFVVEDNKITMKNLKNNATVIIDNEGIKLNGDVFINGNKI